MTQGLIDDDVQGSGDPDGPPPPQHNQQPPKKIMRLDQSHNDPDPTDAAVVSSIPDNIPDNGPVVPVVIVVANPDDVVVVTENVVEDPKEEEDPKPDQDAMKNDAAGCLRNDQKPRGEGVVLSVAMKTSNLNDNVKLATRTEVKKEPVFVFGSRDFRERLKSNPPVAKEKHKREIRPGTKQVKESLKSSLKTSMKDWLVNKVKTDKLDSNVNKDEPAKDAIGDHLLPPRQVLGPHDSLEDGVLWTHAGSHRKRGDESPSEGLVECACEAEIGTSEDLKKGKG